MEPTAWAAGQNGDKPGDRPMTRHGMIQPPVAGAQPSATEPRTLIVIIEGERAASSRSSNRQYRVKAQ